MAPSSLLWPTTTCVFIFYFYFVASGLAAARHRTFANFFDFEFSIADFRIVGPGKPRRSPCSKQYGLQKVARCAEHITVNHTVECDSRIRAHCHVCTRSMYTKHSSNASSQSYSSRTWILELNFCPPPTGLKVCSGPKKLISVVD